MKNFYYAVQAEENGKQYAYIIKTTAANNLISLFARIANAKIISPCYTKKSAELIVKGWRQSYKENGTAMLEC